MKLMLFLDDWFLDAKYDMERVFAQPRPMQLTGADEMGFSTIIFDPELDCFRAWSKKLDTEEAFLFHSDDGISWQKTGVSMKVYPKQNFHEQIWFYDPWDENPERRHKMTVWPYARGVYGGRGLIACSKDGVSWKNHQEYAWSPPKGNGSDTINNLFYNPFTGKWGVVCRKYHADRRIAIVTSTDLQNWSEPRIIFHPDNLDPAMLQFYGMKVELYENDYFFGFLQCYHVPMQDHGLRTLPKLKMSGKITCQLTYSYDGEHWLRSDRSSFFPRVEPGKYGGSTIATRSMVESRDNRLFIYSIASSTDHGYNSSVKRASASTEQVIRGKLLLHVLRRDGFSYMTPVGGWGRLVTRVLVPGKSELTINYQAPLGQVLVQITDAAGKPIPGYSFEDCIPLQGDALNQPVQWKNHQDLSKLVGKPIRLEIKMIDARIYALRFEFGLWYTTTKKPIDRL